MLLQDLYDCSRPMMFEHDDRPDYPYELFGSGFLLTYRQSYFLVTAKHVIGERSPEQIRVFADESFDRSLPLNLIARPDNVDPDDWDQGDVVVLRIQHNDLTPEELEVIGRFDLAQARPVAAAPNDQLFFTGYPTEDRWINFDEQSFGFRRVIGAARYEGAGVAAHTHRIADVNKGAVADMDGFSGSPVFRAIKRERYVVTTFAGIMIRAAYYLDGLLLLRMLDQIVDP